MSTSPRKPARLLSRSSLMVAAALLGVAVSSAPKAQAANLYWDNDTSVAGTGGSGSWSDDKSSNWSVSSVGDTAASAGTFSSADIAYFTGTAGTATLAGPITIGGLVFNGADFTVTGDTLTLAADSGAPTITVSRLNVATLSSIVAGTSGLTKSGDGVLRLTNGGNSYTGVTTISAGSLVITSADALGDATSAISILTTNQVPSSGNLYSFGAGSLVLDGSAAGFELARNINFEGRGSIGDRASAILSIGNNTLSGTLTSAVSPLSPVTFRNSRINSVNGTLTLSGSLVSQGTATQTFLNMGGVNIRDAWGHGVMPYTTTGIFGKSSNVGTLMLAQRIGPERYYEMLGKFGLGQRTGVGLPGESAGIVPPIDQWSGSTFSNLPIGQGLSMTLLQMTGMYQAIANDGMRIPPRIVKATIAADGTSAVEPQPGGIRVVSPETARTVRNMLRAVVQRDPMGTQQGTGAAAAVEGYQIAGKTGTAQQINPGCGCYYDDVYWITFAGMAPVDDPRYVVGLMMDAPVRNSDGTPGHSAAPLFRSITAWLLQRDNVPLSPDPGPPLTLEAA